MKPFGLVDLIVEVLPMESPPILQPSSLSDYGPRLGLLFTDASGRVIFLDNWVLALLGQVRAGELVGEPLHVVFGISQGAADGLMMEIARNGYIRDHSLVITRWAECSGTTSGTWMKGWSR